MKTRIALGVCVALTLAVSGAVADDITSGLQKGGRVTAFSPLNLTGKFAGRKQCLV